MSLQQQDNSLSRNLSRKLQQSLQEVLMEVSLDGNLMLGGSATSAPVANPLYRQGMTNATLSNKFGLAALNMVNFGGAGGAPKNNYLTSSGLNSAALAALSGAGAGATAGKTPHTNFLTPNAAAAAALSAFQSTVGPAASNHSHLRPSEALGLSTEELLMAAATEKRMLEHTQQRLAARQQILAEKTLESRRLYQESLLALMKGSSTTAATATTTSLAALASHNGLMQSGLLQQLKSQQQQQQQQQAPILSATVAARPTPPAPALAETQTKTALKVLGTSLRKKDSPYLDVSGLKDPDVSDKRTRGGVTEPFPEKLHRMLEEVRREGREDVISFFAHGRAFAVHDPERFTTEVMPKYFKQSRLSSFQRQLNLYGFTRITSGADAGGYFHELFLRGRPNLAVHMRRVGLPQGEDRRKTRARNMRSDPNFYVMGNVADAKVTIPGLQH